MLMMGCSHGVLWATWFAKEILFLLPSIIIITTLLKVSMYVNVAIYYKEEELRY